MLYRILLFSLKPQHESAICIYISPPFWTSLPSPSLSHPSRLIQSPCLKFPETYSKFPLAIYFTYGTKEICRTAVEKDIKNKLMDMGRGECEMYGESNMEANILLVHDSFNALIYYTLKYLIFIITQWDRQRRWQYFHWRIWCSQKWITCLCWGPKAWFHLVSDLMPFSPTS